MVSDARLRGARERLIRAGVLGAAGEEPASSVIFDAIRMVAPFECATVMASDPETLLPTSGIFQGLDPKICEPFWDCEAGTPDVHRFVDLATSQTPVAALAETLPKTFEPSARYRKVYANLPPLGDELRVLFRSGSTVLGMAVFLRMGRDKRFSDEEKLAVKKLTAPAAELLRREIFSPAQNARKVQGPVTLLMSNAGELYGHTEGALEILDDLRGGAIGAGTVPPTILAPAARLQYSETGELSTRVRSASGIWYRLHLAPIIGQPGMNALSISSATPAELLPLFLGAYGLTKRESEVASALIRGLSTKEIGVELGISVHTAHDHLKSIYKKARVSSRGELLSRFAIGGIPGADSDDPLPL